MEILMGWLTPVRAIFLFLDTIAFSLIDNAYDLFLAMADQQVIGEGAIEALINNIYVLVGIIAFFRLAILFVNSIINPDKLLDKKAGVGGVLGRIVLMITLLAFTPFIFREMMSLQTEILQRNIIPKTIISSVGGEDIKNRNYVSDAGKTMQKIVIMALIHPDEAYFVDGEQGVTNYLNADVQDNSSSGPSEVESYVIPECNKTCRKAMAQYHQMISQSSKGGFKLRRLAGYIGGSREIATDESGDTQDVYYYEYIAILTTITAIFITYVILSFTIDVAVRSVELAVLRILAPLFIATIIEPKSSDKYFTPYLKRIGKTYADLFIKIAIVSLMVLAVSLVQDLDFGTGSGPFMKIALLYAVLIFAKKAPKMFSEMIGVKGEGLGLKGLNIKNKMGEAVIVGDKVKQGMTKAEGAARGAIGGLAGGVRGSLTAGGGVRGSLGNGLKGAITGGKQGFDMASKTGDVKGAFKNPYSDMKQITKGTKQTFFEKNLINPGKALVEKGAKKIGGAGFNNKEMTDAEERKALMSKIEKMYSIEKVNEIKKIMAECNLSDKEALDVLKAFEDNNGAGTITFIDNQGKEHKVDFGLGDFNNLNELGLKISKEREKIFSNAISQLQLANQYEMSGNVAAAEAIRKEVEKTLAKAKQDHFFDGISDINLSAIAIPKGASTDPYFIASLQKLLSDSSRGIENYQKENDLPQKTDNVSNTSSGGK